MTTIPLHKNAKITDAEIFQNALDFAFGNARMENKYVTREMVQGTAQEALKIVRTLPTVQELAE